MYKHADLTNLDNLKKYVKLNKKFEDLKEDIRAILVCILVLVVLGSSVYLSTTILNLGFLLTLLAGFAFGAILLGLFWLIVLQLKKNRLSGKTHTSYLDILFKSKELLRLEKSNKKLHDEIKNQLKIILHGTTQVPPTMGLKKINEIYDYFYKYRFVDPRNKGILLFLYLFGKTSRDLKASRVNKISNKSLVEMYLSNRPRRPNSNVGLGPGGRIPANYNSVEEAHYIEPTENIEIVSDRSIIVASNNNQVLLPSLNKSLESRLEEINLTYKFSK